nr:MAG TPA_asm: hypothetical protein [Caudoviricetes sp.]
MTVVSKHNAAPGTEVCRLCRDSRQCINGTFCVRYDTYVEFRIIKPCRQ